MKAALIGVSTIAMVLAAPAHAAPVQTTAATPPAIPAATTPEDDTSRDIVVTATKREQTLQDVPVAVSVVGAQTIQQAQIRDVADLASVVPSLRVDQAASSATTTFFIRGFGNGANNVGIEPSVGVFIDGVYRSRSASQIEDFPDIQRVEVLRGPQSTLFGKNASAGVISVVTAAPRQEFGGNVEASYGNYDAVVVKGVVTGPVVKDVLAFSIAGGLNQRDGYLRDPGSGRRFNDRDRWFARGQLLLTPGSDLRLRLIGDYSKIDEQCCGVVNLRRSDATTVIEAMGGRVNDFRTPFSDIVYTNADSPNHIRNYGGSAQVDYQAGPIALTSITALRQTDASQNQDADFSSADLIGGIFQDQDIRTFTQEARITSSFDGPLNFLLGGFYFDEKIRQTGQLRFGRDLRRYVNALIGGSPANAAAVAGLEGTFGALAGNPGLYTGRFYAAGQGLDEEYALHDKSYSVFGQVDVAVTDRLTLTGGLNYTHDAKDFSTNVTSTDVFSSLDLGAVRASAINAGIAQTVGGLLGVPGGFASAAQIAAFAGANPQGFAQIQAGATAATAQIAGLASLQTLPPFLNVPNPVEPGRTRDSDVAYTLRAAYDVNDRVNVYASYATGFKASSINLSRDSRPSVVDLAALRARGLATTNLVAGSRLAGPEDSEVYEIGLKADWRVVTLNVAAFRQTIKGFQSNIFTGTGYALANAGKQRVEGFEVEGTARPVPPLSLSFALTYLDPRYVSFRQSPLGDLSGTRPASIPPISTTFVAAYEHRFDNGNKVTLRADHHFEASSQIVEGLPAFLAAGTAAAIEAGRPFKREVSTVNASITYGLGNGLELTAWARNLFDNRYLTTVFDSVLQPLSVSGYVNQPRTYGGAVRFRF